MSRHPCPRTAGRGCDESAPVAPQTPEAGGKPNLHRLLSINLQGASRAWTVALTALAQAGEGCGRVLGGPSRSSVGIRKRLMHIRGAVRESSPRHGRADGVCTGQPRWCSADDSHLESSCDATVWSGARPGQGLPDLRLPDLNQLWALPGARVPAAVTADPRPHAVARLSERGVTGSAPVVGQPC